jgi:hypothetical protein
MFLKMRGRKVLSFDTSGINALRGDSESASLMAGVKTGFHTRLNATNVDEVIATSEEAERTALLDVCQQLLGGGDCIQPYHWILEILISDYERHGKSSWKSLDIRARDYEQEILSREVAHALSQEQRTFAKQAQKQFVDLFGDPRPEFEKLFAAGTGRPSSFRELVTVLQVTGGAFWSYAAVLYERVAGHKPAEDKLRDFVADCPPFHALVLAIVMAQYERSVRDLKVGASYRAERLDLYAAVYLPYCDQFITADERQERCLREIAAVAGLGVAIRSYKDFRKETIG